MDVTGNLLRYLLGLLPQDSGTQYPSQSEVTGVQQDWKYKLLERARAFKGLMS